MTKSTSVKSGKGNELRELVAGLKTRSPEEVMGSIATSSLMGSVITATFGFAAFLVVATLLVFLLVGPPSIKKPDTKKTAQTSDDAKGVLVDQDVTVVPADDAGDGTSGDATKDTTNAGDDKQGAVEAMGIGETKNPDESSESLDNRIDDLLKGLE